jgi:Transposase IS4
MLTQIFSFQTTVNQVISGGTTRTLDEFMAVDELPDPEGPEPAVAGPAAGPAVPPAGPAVPPAGPAVPPAGPAGPAVPSRWQTNRSEWEWEAEARSFKSKGEGIFPAPNFTRFKNLAPVDLFDLFVDRDILSLIATKTNEYALNKGGGEHKISSDNIRVFFGILILSGYNKVTNFRLYWSNSEDTENKMVKAAMSKNTFLDVKRFFHMGVNPTVKQVVEGEEPSEDRYKKVRNLSNHLQAKFLEMFVPEQNLSHDEAMIKYFGKNGLKQSLRNKPIRFGFKVWVLATVSGYVVSFDLYQGKGVGIHHNENVKTVGAAAASVLDLLDLLPEEKANLPYHIYADNFFSSHKLIEVLTAHNIQYTGTIRQDRVKGKPPLTPVDKFKKKDRGYYETVVLADKSQIVTRWNDNAAVTLISSCHGDKPLGTAKRWSRKEKKRIDVPQPHVVGQYNRKMIGVDRFDQNTNHLRISIGGKKWYWPVTTWLLDTAMSNAWQLHKKSGGGLTLLEFKREVVCSILRGAAATRGQQLSPGPTGSRPGGDVRYDGIGHYVKRRPERRRCHMCQSKCVTYCGKCDCHLCIDDFQVYHTKK